MLNLFMFIYCEAMLILFADTNRMLNKSSLRFYLGRMRGSAGDHGPKKVENRWTIV